MVTIRSFEGMNPESALSKVVLPEPVPPEMMMFNLDIDAGTQKIGHIFRHAASFDKLVHRELFFQEFPDGDRRTIDGHRRNDRIHARAIRQAGIHHRAVGVDAPTQRKDDTVDQSQHFIVIFKHNRGFHQNAGFFDIDFLGAVHHDLGDKWVIQERLNGAKTD